MSYVPKDKLTELEKILIDALNNSCQPGCSHEGCHKLNSDIYWKGAGIAEVYLDPEVKLL